MRKLLIKTLFSVLSLFFLIAGLNFAQKDNSNEYKDLQMKDYKMLNYSMTMDSTQNKISNKKDSIIREGIIDLTEVDKNKDGKVYQDMMDYNVISDKAGNCPLCEMKLKEVSLKNAKESLLKSGYKVK
jgi:Heavy metal binding domain